MFSCPCSSFVVLCFDCHTSPFETLILFVMNHGEWQNGRANFVNTCSNRRLPEITGEGNLTIFSYSGRVKSLEWRWQRRTADLRHFENFRHGPIIIYTRLPAEGTYYPICTFPASSEYLIDISDAFSAFVYGCPSSSPRAHCNPNKSVPTLRYTRRHGPIYTGPCPKALTECSPLDFRRSSIVVVHLCAALECQLIDLSV